MNVPWGEKTVIYHIYVRSFKDSNGDGVGDLNGIIEKLDYLNDSTPHSLGINAIWLSPIYPSPNIDFGYDISNYIDINLEYGDLETFKRLLNESHNRGIKIMMDFVPNHTSDEHVWFQQSRSSKDNPLRNYYIWRSPKEDGGVPNNWVSTMGGSAWEFDQQTGEYYLHTFHKKQPDLNWRNPEVVNEMIQTLKFWLEIGVDGFRADVPEWIFKDSEFRDEPVNPDFNPNWPDRYGSLQHIYTVGLAEVNPMLLKFVNLLAEYHDRFLVIETWSPIEKRVQMYQEIGSKYFSPFNFDLIQLPWEAQAHRHAIDRFDKEVGANYFPAYVLGSHDKSRIATRIGREKIRMAALLLLSLRGIPFIYYGEELGMEDGQILPDQVKDTVENIIPGIGLGRDAQRTPMQWNSDEFSGFSTTKPWLPVAGSYEKYNVETEQQDSKSVLALYKSIIRLKQIEPALQFGEYVSLEVGTDQAFVFTRTFENDKIVVLLNYSLQQVEIDLPFNTGNLLIETEMNRTNEMVSLNKILLNPLQGMLIKIVT